MKLKFEIEGGERMIKELEVYKSQRGASFIRECELAKMSEYTATKKYFKNLGNTLRSKGIYESFKKELIATACSLAYRFGSVLLNINPFERLFYGKKIGCKVLRYATILDKLDDLREELTMSEILELRNHYDSWVLD